jgi:hypothetical protein
MNKERELIGSSNLTFLWNKCKKCLWLKYNYRISTPKLFPLVRPISAFQERMYRERATNYLTSELEHEKNWLWLSFNPCQKHEIAAK